MPTGSNRLVIDYSDTLGMFAFSAMDAVNDIRVYSSTDDGLTWTASNLVPTFGATSSRGITWIGNGVNSWYLSGRAESYYGESTNAIDWTVTAFPVGVTTNQFGAMAFDGTATIFGGSSGSGDFALIGVLSTASVDSLTPDFGPSGGGTVVTITGTGLSGVTSVTFGGTASPDVVVVDDETLTVVTPPHVKGLFDVIVVGVGSLTNAFSFVEVTRVSSRAGTVAGSTPVTITGFGFNAASGVTFGGTAATSVIIVSNASITAVTPAHASGAVDVEVLGVATGEGLYTYTLPVPQVLGKGPLLPPIPTRGRA